MSDSRLLIAVEVLDFLRTLRPAEQRALLKRFREIAAFPGNYSDFVERDSAGRRVTVLDVHLADRLG